MQTCVAVFYAKPKTSVRGEEATQLVIVLVTLNGRCEFNPPLGLLYCIIDAPVHLAENAY